MSNFISFNFVTLCSFGCVDICLNMIKSLLLVSPNSKMTVFCYDEDTLNFFEEKHLPIELLLRPYNSTLDKQYHLYATDGFNKLSRHKFNVMLDYMSISDAPYHYVDCDLFFCQCPLSQYSKLFSNNNYDMFFQTDNPGDEYCTGSILIKNTDYCKDFIKRCIEECSSSDQHDQCIVNRILHNSKEHGIIERITTLDSNLFPNGYVFFKEKTTTNPIIVHANFLVGMDAKINALKDANMWII